MIHARRILQFIAALALVPALFVLGGSKAPPEDAKPFAHGSVGKHGRGGSVAHPAPAADHSLDEVVLSEDFELASLGALPSGWRQVDGDGGYSSWFERSSIWQVFSREYFTAHSGTRVAMCHFNDGEVPNDDWLILPQQSLTDTITLRYWAASQDEQFLESFEVRVSTTGTAPADFTHLIAGVSLVPPVWTEYVHDLSAFAGSPFYVAFHYTSVSRFVLKLDDVSLEASGTVSGTISGTVTDDSLRPVYGAMARILGLGRSARTDTLGVFTLSRLPAGVYDVLLSHEFYEPSALNDLTVTVSETTWAAASLTPLPLRFHDYVSWVEDQAIADFDTAIMWINIPDTLVIYDLDATVSINHSYVGDLDIWLLSPDTTYVQLMMHDPHNSGHNLTGCRFDDEAVLSYTAGSAPYTGRWQPFEPLARFNGDSTLLPRGEIRYRTWSLLVYDNGIGDVGWIRDFQLHVAEGVPLAVGDVRPEAARVFAFEGNYPNPFNARTELRFTLHRPGLVELTVFDLTGRRVSVLARGNMERGVHVIPFDASALASGIYFARLNASGLSATRKMILLR